MDKNKALWDYHVVVGYTDKTEQDWIIDKLISSKPLKLLEWISNFKVNNYAVLVKINPQMYLFNKTQIPTSSFSKYFIYKNIFNGSFYTYTGKAYNQHRAASDLAIDALSDKLINDNFMNCEWKELVLSPLILKSKIQELNSTIPNNCKKAKLFFNNKFKIWKNRGL